VIKLPNDVILGNHCPIWKMGRSVDVPMGAASCTTLAVGGGTMITDIAVYPVSLTPASVGAATTAEQTFTVTGLATNDKVFVNGPAPTAGTGIVGARVSAANTLAITFANVTAAALTPAAGTYTILAIRS
jgi:hypothetical protein